MDQLLAIRVFARVVEAGSFTKAADTLDMPNASVTKLIQALEAHVGVRLLLRTTRRVTVTPDGAAYYERTARLLKDLGDIDNSFGAAQSTPRGQLRIDTGSSIATHIVVPALGEFMRLYPDIRIDLGVSDKPVDLIGENIDCVIRGGALTDESLVARQIGAAALVTCATPDYLARHGVPQHPRELERGHVVVNYVSARSGRVLPMHFQRGGEKLEITPQRSLGINESNAHFAAGVAGLGVVQTFDYMVREHLAAGTLVAVLEEWQPAAYPFYVVYPQNRHMSNRLRVFIDWIATRFSGGPA